VDLPEHFYANRRREFWLPAVCAELYVAVLGVLSLVVCAEDIHQALMLGCNAGTGIKLVYLCPLF
jgi:hypothetical protein